MAKVDVRNEIGSLTGLRGVASCWVVIYHMHEFDHINGPFAVLLRHGYLAVDVFFILSGFVMALSYNELFLNGFRVKSYLLFLGRRFARVYPLYFVLTLACASPAAFHTAARINWLHFGITLALNLSLTESWGWGSPIDGPAWSVSTEFAAYLLFPLLAYATIYGRDRLAAASVIAALTI